MGIVSMVILASLWFITGNAHAATTHNHADIGTQTFCSRVGSTGNHDSVVSVGFNVSTFTAPCVINQVWAQTLQDVANLTVTLWGYDGVYHTIETTTVYRVPGLPCCGASLPAVTAQCGMVYHAEAIARYWILWGTILVSDTVNTDAYTIC